MDKFIITDESGRYGEILDEGKQFPDIFYFGKDISKASIFDDASFKILWPGYPKVEKFYISGREELESLISFKNIIE